MGGMHSKIGHLNVLDQYLRESTHIGAFKYCTDMGGHQV